MVEGPVFSRKNTMFVMFFNGSYEFRWVLKTVVGFFHVFFLVRSKLMYFSGCAFQGGIPFRSWENKRCLNSCEKSIISSRLLSKIQMEGPRNL